VSSPVLANHQVLDQIGDRHQTLLVPAEGRGGSIPKISVVPSPHSGLRVAPWSAGAREIDCSAQCPGRSQRWCLPCASRAPGGPVAHSATGGARRRGLRPLQTIGAMLPHTLGRDACPMKQPAGSVYSEFRIWRAPGRHAARRLRPCRGSVPGDRVWCRCNPAPAPAASVPTSLEPARPPPRRESGGFSSSVTRPSRQLLVDWASSMQIEEQDRWELVCAVMSTWWWALALQVAC
jgi:hypothetical protein